MNGRMENREISEKIDNNGYWKEYLRFKVNSNG